MQTKFTLDDYQAICRTIGDSPFTVIPTYHMLQEAVNVTLLGTTDCIEGLAIQLRNLPEEPIVFGESPQAILACLQSLKGWKYVNVSFELADELSHLLSVSLRRSIQSFGDIHYILEQPLKVNKLSLHHITCRFLTKDDIGKVDNIPVDLINSSIGNYVAGAILDNNMAALAHVSAISDKYADIGVHTDESMRKQGISTYLSQMVIQRLQSEGYIPVWSTGEENFASNRVAEKLGMKFYGKRIYLILEENN